MTEPAKVYSKSTKRAVYVFSYLYVMFIALQNANYGYERTAYSLAFVIAISVGLFFSTDFATSVIAEIMVPEDKRRKILCVGLIGGIFVSLWCGASFTSSLQHKADRQHSNVDTYNQSEQALQNAIASSANVYKDTHGNPNARLAMESATNALLKINSQKSAEIKSKGLDIDSSNALALKVSRLMGYSYDATVFAIGLILNSIMILVAFCFSVGRSSVKTIEDYKREKESREELQAIMKSSAKPAAQKTSSKGVEDAMKLVLEKRVKPSKKKLEEKGVNREVAKKAIDKLKADGDIVKVGNSNYYELVA